MIVGLLVSMLFVDAGKACEAVLVQKSGWPVVFGQSAATTGGKIRHFCGESSAVRQHTTGGVTGERCKRLAVNRRFCLRDRMFLAPVWRLTPKLLR